MQETMLYLFLNFGGHIEGPVSMDDCRKAIELAQEARSTGATFAYGGPGIDVPVYRVDCSEWSVILEIQPSAGDCELGAGA